LREKRDFWIGNKLVPLRVTMIKLFRKS